MGPVVSRSVLIHERIIHQDAQARPDQKAKRHPKKDQRKEMKKDATKDTASATDAPAAK